MFCVCVWREDGAPVHPPLPALLHHPRPHRPPYCSRACVCGCGVRGCVRGVGLCVCAWGMGVVWDKGLRWFGGALLRAPPVAEVTVLCTGCVCLCVLVSCVGVWVGGCGSCGNSGRTPFVVRRSIFLRGCGGVGGVCVWWWGLFDVAPPPPPPCATPLPPSVNARGPYSRVLWGCSCPHPPHLHLLPPPCVHPCFVSVFWPATIVCAPSPPFPTPSFPVRSPRVCFSCVCRLWFSFVFCNPACCVWTLHVPHTCPLAGTEMDTQAAATMVLVCCALVED